MKRYIIISKKAGVYDGAFYSTQILKQNKQALSEKWPGLDWRITEVEHGFPVPRLMHQGEVHTESILKRCQKSLECEPGNAH